MTHAASPARRPAATALACLLVLFGSVSAAAEEAARADPGPGRTELVTVAVDGAVLGGVTPGSVSISGDGRHAAFTTSAALDPDDLDTVDDVYVRDRSGSGSTVWISRGPGPADRRPSGAPSLSASGRFVAFVTTDYVGGAESGQRVFVCDRDPDGDGVFDERRPDGAVEHRFTAVSRSLAGTGLSDDGDPSLSADGLTVVWNEGPGNGASWTVAARLTVGPNGTVDPPAGDSYLELIPVEPDVRFVLLGQDPPHVSADGRHALVPALLCPGPCGPRLSASAAAPVEPAPRRVLYAVDLTGPGRPPLRRIDVGPDGAPVGLGAHEPAISGNGAVVAFTVIGAEGPQVQVVDRDPNGDGRLWPDAEQPARFGVGSRAADGAADSAGGGDQPALSADGRLLAFRTRSAGMHNGTDRPAGGAQVVARDIRRDARRDAEELPVAPAELVSVATGTSCPPPATACGGGDDSGAPALSADGTVVAFTSAADDLVSGGGGSAADPGPALGAPGGLLVVDAAYARVLQPRPVADPVDIGAVPGGGEQNVEIPVRHAGFGRLRIDAVTISGPSAGEFAVGPEPGTCVGVDLYQDDVCTVAVRFVPTGPPGPRTAAMALAAGGGSTTVPLVGSVTDPVSAPVSTSAPPPATTSGPSPTPTPTPSSLRDQDPTTPPTGTAPSPPAPPPVPSERAGILALSPAVVVAGRVVQVVGTGFPADRPIQVTLRGAVGTAPLSVRTDRAGNFRGALLLTGNGGPVGTMPVVATAEGVPGEVTAPLLVVSGTYQPPGFVGRR